MTFKPQLLSNDSYDVSTLNYSLERWFGSIKRDGVRLAYNAGVFKTRRLKSFRNINLADYFSELTSVDTEDLILEGEIYCHGIPLREISGILNSSDKEIPEGTKLYVFGLYGENLTFEERYNKLKKLEIYSDKVELVHQEHVTSYEKVKTIYDNALAFGYEGAVLMNGASKYKCGRFTVKQKFGYKLKPHEEIDLEIVGVTERMENLNESTTDELGHSVKRNTVADKAHTGIASCFECLMPDGKTITKVNIGNTEDYRRDVWEHKDDYVGQFAVINSMTYGTKDKLRFPQLRGLKYECEK